MSFQTGITMEYTQDLHLKMSKKIAQLTKVRGLLFIISSLSPLSCVYQPTLGLKTLHTSLFLRTKLH